MTRDVFGDVHDPEQLLGELAGAVSLCWVPRPTGDFDATAAGEFVDAAITRLRVLISESAIRADEAKRMNHRWRTQVLDNERDRMRLDILADLRVKVASLNAPGVQTGPHAAGYDYAVAAVLALLDGGDP